MAIDLALTAALIGSEVDLRDFDYMPLYGDRLFRSETWILGTADSRCAAIRLWWAAWHEEPAGSLPDNDRLLADMAGYGVAVSAFCEIKEAAMRGWVKCDDGRLYHPVVCQIAAEMFKKKKKKQEDNAAERARKKRKRNNSAGPTAGHPSDDPVDIPPDTQPLSAGQHAVVPPENALKEKGSRREEESPLPPKRGTKVVEGFSAWYAIYPLKRDPGHAEKAFAKAVREGTPPETLMQGAHRYALSVFGKDQQFTKYPTTWLNGRCWLDEDGASHNHAANGAAVPRDPARDPARPPSPEHVWSPLSEEWIVPKNAHERENRSLDTESWGAHRMGEWRSVIRSWIGWGEDHEPEKVLRHWDSRDGPPPFVEATSSVPWRIVREFLDDPRYLRLRAAWEESVRNPPKPTRSRPVRPIGLPLDEPPQGGP